MTTFYDDKRNYYLCFKTCWFWDLQRDFLFKDNVRIQRRITAAQRTYGIWSHLPKDFLNDLEAM